MKTEQNYWHRRWQENEIGFHEGAVNPLLQTYLPPLCKTGSMVFVPLCGKTNDMIWLMSQGYRVIGCELNPIACEAFFKDNNLDYQIEEAENFTIYKNPQTTLYCGDIFNLTKEQLSDVNFVYDRAAAIALPESTRQQYAKHLSTILPNHAEILMIVLTYDQERNDPPYCVTEDNVKQIFEHYDLTVLDVSTTEAMAKRNFINPENHVLHLKKG